jgi:class 3 adenylate cyclase
MPDRSSLANAATPNASSPNFGDTMNVAARLCEYCKTINRRLVVSGEALRLTTAPADLVVGKGESVAARGRQGRVEVHVVEPRS